MRDRFIWGMVAFGVSLCFGAWYLTVQQTLRHAANDPQISMAQDAAGKLDSGSNPAAIASKKIEASYDMAPFIIIYDLHGNVVAGNGYVDGSVPHVPISVLRHAKLNGGVHVITWQPREGIRIASATARSRDFYVVSGRSLDTTDRQINSLALYTASAWLTAMAAIIAGYCFTQRRSS